MKKTIAILSVLALLLCVSLTAAEAETLPIGEYLEEIFSDPANIEEQNGTYLVRADISSYNIAPDSPLLEELTFGFVYSHPGLFWLKSQSAYSSDEEKVYSLFLYCNMSEEKVAAAKPAFDKAADAILAGITPTMTDEEKLLYIHDAICVIADYDYSFTNRSAYDILVNHTAVCQGYSLAFNYLAGQIGFETAYVSTDDSEIGQRQNHGWSAVKIGSNWYYVDVTHDDASHDFYLAFGYGQGALALHDNFLVSEETIRSHPIADIAPRAFTPPSYVVAEDKSFEGRLTPVEGKKPDSAFVYLDGFWYVPICETNPGKVCLFKTENPFLGSYSLVTESPIGRFGTYYPMSVAAKWKNKILVTIPGGLISYEPITGKTTRLADLSQTDDSVFTGSVSEDGTFFRMVCRDVSKSTYELVQVTLPEPKTLFDAIRICIALSGGSDAYSVNDILAIISEIVAA